MILFTVSGAVLVILQYFFLNCFTAFIILFTVVMGVDT